MSFHRDFIKVKDDHIEIGIMAKPVKGQANVEIVKKIAKHFGVSRSNVRIMSGEKLRDKIIEVRTTPNPKK
ncbi:MAG: DUF167 domain-containing protein [Nitrososphaera sp.]